MSRDSSPFRYLRWFGWDTLLFPFSVFLLATVGIGFLLWRIASKFEAGPALGSIAHQMQIGVWNTCLTVAVLMAMTPVVGADMQRGYYRVWFSKPMPAWWYYLQRFLLGALAVLVSPWLIGLAVKVAVGGDLGVDGHLIATMALGVLLIGSATFLMSIFTPRGWLIVYLVDVMQTIIGGLQEKIADSGVHLPGFFVWLHRLLPPFDLIDVQRDALTGRELTHVLGYGVVMLAASLILLVQRPLGSGGRA